MPGELILIIDDEPDISELIGMYLDKEGYPFHTASSGAEALHHVAAFEPQLIILDVQLPDIEGYELCTQLRKTTTVPILFLTCKDTEMDMVIGLSVGGDDFVSKPFSPLTLLARIKAHLRRSKLAISSTALPSDEGSGVQHAWTGSGSLKINKLSHEVMLDGKEIDLSTKEFQLLAMLMSHPRQVLTSEQILQRIWGYDLSTDTKTLQVHIGTLRKKVERDPAKPSAIINVRGIGYKYNEQA